MPRKNTSRSLDISGFGCIDSRTIPYQVQVTQAMERAGKMSQYAGNAKVGAFPIGYGGKKDWQLFEPFLRDAGIGVEPCPLGCMQQSDREYGRGEDTGLTDLEGDFRVITDPPRKLVVPDAPIALLFDDMNTSGRSYAGGLVYLLLNQKTFGFQEVWTSCVADRMGLIRWPVIERVPDRGNYGKDWERFMTEKMPDTYRLLQERELFKFLRTKW